MASAMGSGHEAEALLLLQPRSVAKIPWFWGARRLWGHRDTPTALWWLILGGNNGLFGGKASCWGHLGCFWVRHHVGYRQHRCCQGGVSGGTRRRAPEPGWARGAAKTGRAGGHRGILGIPASGTAARPRAGRLQGSQEPLASLAASSAWEKPGLLSHFPFYLLFLVGFSGSPWPPTLPSPAAGFFRECRRAIGEGWRKLPLLYRSTREMEAEPC